jgi:hypothetical protein
MMGELEVAIFYHAPLHGGQPSARVVFAIANQGFAGILPTLYTSRAAIV